MTLSSIEGRLKSLCVAGDGRLVTHREMDDALARVEGMEQYRLVQHSLKSARLEVSAEEGQEKRAAQDAGDILNELFGRGVEVSVSRVSALQPERSGKFLLAKREFPLAPGVATARTEAVYG
jgi:hypothetical protein